MGSSVNTQYRIKQAKKPKLSLCMIVKDEEEFLDGCLESIKDVIDEIIVLDTGSTDNTVQIAEAYGAKIHKYEWNNNYSDARNKSKEYATGDWILILDADERLDPGSKQKVLSLITNPAVDSYNVYKRDYLGSSSDSEYLVNCTGRLFRNRPEYKYRGRVHESVEPSIVAAGGTVELVEILIHHFGYSPKVMDAREKYGKYMELMLNELEADPDSIYYLVHIGRAYSSHDEYEPASKAFMRASELITADHPFAMDILVGCINAFCMLNKPEDALKVIEQAHQMKITSPELAFCRGNTYFLSGRYQEAIAEYKLAVASATNSHYRAGDPSTWGEKSYAGIAKACFEIGNYEEALEYAKQVAAIKPNLAEAHDSLGRIYAAMGQAADAINCFGKAVEVQPDYSNAYFNAGDILYALGNFQEAAEVYLSGLNYSPDHAPAYFTIGNCCFRLAEYGAASEAYRQALSICPDYAEAQSNLELAQEAMATGH